MGLNNGLHNVSVRIERGQSFLAPPPFNKNNNKVVKDENLYSSRKDSNLLLMLHDNYLICLVESYKQQIEEVGSKKSTENLESKGNS